MKTQTVFQNSSLVSVVNGSIVVKDSTGGEHTFVKASVVSVNNGTIIIESEWKPKKGELVKVVGCGIDCYAIFNSKAGYALYTFGNKEISGNWYSLKPHIWTGAESVEFYPVTPEEQKEFDDFCKSQGKIWNKETLQWEKYRWKPSFNERYYIIDLFPLDMGVRTHTWVDDHMDNGYYKTNNCFKTEEEAKAKLEAIKKIFE